MHSVIKTIQKTITKRQHKLIDYDRYRTSHQKFKNMADRSPSEDKQVYKLEGQLETATQDYEYLNDMLKQDLMRFFRLASSFIGPVQENFYSIQCRVIGGMYGRIYEVVDSHREYFVTLDQPLEDGFQWRMRQRDVKSELEQLDVLKKGSSLNGNLVRPEQATLQERAAAKQQQQQYQEQQPPPYYQQQHAPLADPVAPSSAQQRRAPPPPPPKPRMKEVVVALYDLDAQQEGDLSIRSGDRIEIVEKTDNTMDWWKGRIGDREGMFPGKIPSDNGGGGKFAMWQEANGNSPFCLFFPHSANYVEPSL
ncbi:hypothetical protein BDB00DRAFT_176877 [Zychaea mexicana]|uniref:uncharacterized protein n=1 Tax=Zychaea mexicana TaxID=64656 RepID=UPI0022FE5122|nr:uncharacterized protein BDB00DRAFT_176877 [Zychaea mexicana]KAI9495909.1 hypothetical protein BDB00DRAFT_176877 [Zychaea mexicana]